MGPLSLPSRKGNHLETSSAPQESCPHCKLEVQPRSYEIGLEDKPEAGAWFVENVGVCPISARTDGRSRGELLEGCGCCPSCGLALPGHMIPLTCPFPMQDQSCSAPKLAWLLTGLPLSAQWQNCSCAEEAPSPSPSFGDPSL